MLANTPPPPYYAVIFSSVRTDVDGGYAAMARYMLELAAVQPGFLGEESARNEIGITVSYWKDEDSIRRWKAHADHQIAQEYGRKKWYRAYRVRICRVEREYAF